MDEQAPMITRTQIKVITPPAITPGKRIEPGNTGGVAQQQLQQSFMVGGAYGSKYNKPTKNNTVGFIKLYEIIKHRLTKKER